MDRNFNAVQIKIVKMVALRKESVDRNLCWVLSDSITPLVALRKESVDRNVAARVEGQSYSVALRKESVDRNCQLLPQPFLPYCRSPQGERG